jgi:hypothetical protein
MVCKNQRRSERENNLIRKKQTGNNEKLARGSRSGKLAGENDGVGVVERRTRDNEENERRVLRQTTREEEKKRGRLTSCPLAVRLDAGTGSHPASRGIGSGPGTMVHALRE